MEIDSDIMHYIFDIDDTICDTQGKDYMNAKPRQDIIDIINVLYENGGYVVIETARGSTSGIDWREDTEKQLKSWGVKYHELNFIKMPFNYLRINDKACNIKNIQEFIYG